MVAAWSRLSREHRRAWGTVAGVIIAGSVIKVAYFSFSRQLLAYDHQRKQTDYLEHLREAQEYAVWSKNDRESKLPPLSEEERTAMRAYLQLIDQHGTERMATSGNECVGDCPALSRFVRRATTARLSSSGDRPEPPPPLAGTD